jgi:hypothetical protein
MNYIGLAGEEQISAASHLREFNAAYGESSDPKTLYQLQQLFIRFAPLWPRVTFLLESIVSIYSGLDEALFRFYDLYFTLNESKGSQHPHGAIPFLERPLGGSRAADPFDYINLKATKTEKNYCLILVRWALNDTNATEAAKFWYLEHAREVLEAARDQDRKLICSELLSEKTMKMISEVTVPSDSGFWRARKGIAERERELDGALKRVREALENVGKSAGQAGRSTLTTPPPFDGIEYGASPILPTYAGETARDPTPHAPRVAFSPPSRSPSPSRTGRARFSPPLAQLTLSHGDRRVRSHSRESAFSAAASASSIVTWAPTEPEEMTISMKVFSPALDKWVESIGIMDTGCEGGNFISSSFLSEHLNMFSSIETDPDADHMEFVDFGGNTDFKPLGKVKLKWYGRVMEVGGGRRGKRSLESEGWFKVAQHLPSEDGEAPFEILLGKDWLVQNNVLRFRGLRLYKRREKKTLEMQRLEDAEMVRRTALRDEAEVSSCRFRIPGWLTLASA